MKKLIWKCIKLAFAHRSSGSIVVLINKWQHRLLHLYRINSEEQNNKDNQGLFAATSSFMLSQSSGNMKIGADHVVVVVWLYLTMPVHMSGEGGMKSCENLGASGRINSGK